MRLHKCLLAGIATAIFAMPTIVSADLVTFDFDNPASDDLETGIGGFQTATSALGVDVTLTTTDITGYVDDGMGGTVLESLTSNPSAGHEVSIRSNGSGQVGIQSAVDNGFLSNAGHFNPGESWTFTFDHEVTFISLDLQSYDDFTENNQFTISSGGTSLVFNEDTFPDDAVDIQFTGPLALVVPAGQQITFAASNFDSTEAFNESSEFRIPDFVVDIQAVPGPSSLALLGLIGGVAMVRRRR